MRFTVIFLAASAGLVAAQTDPAGQCIQTCFTKVGQDNPDLPDIKRCEALADGLQQLLCLCRTPALVDAFTACAGQTCQEFAAQVNGTAICQSSETGALDPSGSGDTGLSDTASGAGAPDPSNTATGAGAANGTGTGASNTASGAGASNTASGVGASNTASGAGAGGTPASAPASGGADSGNGARSYGVAMVDFVVAGAALVLASGFLV